MMKSTTALLCLMFAAASSWAAGPSHIALSDRSLWPDTVTTADGFDRASRAEIMEFAAALAATGELTEDALKKELRINSVDPESVARVRNRLLETLLKNYRIASKPCSSNEPFCEKADSTKALIAAGKALSEHLPAQYVRWHDHAVVFHRLYSNELLRLAALFPSVSSEIDVLNSRERNGFELADRHFLLTFDDGPTHGKGNSELLISQLAKRDVHGLFFVLGERLRARSLEKRAIDLQTLYQDQCVALHGWEHQSHQKWAQWQSSVRDTQQLLKTALPQNYRPYFRPPYGQRRNDAQPFFDANGLTVILWNIDSQDWNANISGQQAAQRVFTLMLLWRRGMILFHDIHAKSQTAVPWLLEQTASAGITWEDCRDY